MLKFSGDLHSFAAILVRQYPLDPYYVGVQGLPDFAALAMAYIVLILKLLFGIDDNTEKLVSLSFTVIFWRDHCYNIGYAAILRLEAYL